MQIVCLDLEGVLIPEIWIKFAEKTGIDELRATTRDIPDYDELMQQRLRILDEHNLKLPAIQEVIAGLEPMPGARAFLDGLRENYQVIILSDTYYEFAKPMMEQLAWPTLFCHKLDVADDGRVVNYVLRQKDPKRHSVKALKQLNYTVFAAGDSYNDTTMLEEADAGFLFRAPQNVIDEFPQYKVTEEYDTLRSYFDEAAAG
ncbi:MAG: bifunctional phosphoserine phosphatase/homoserine phosphotransferase ThrH [Gammaproteobacteria bacterium]|jgi:phosphoserine / homoserine phosphotransferase|nr:bifunctional phosphoserine phosphatase/homoserine phosphotransferase ThrH [Gammaproteobacteria bacterium]MBT7371166.1 bifunctional phosphoserine phosphatase/homoserine phosphotransferase ThrH [Gammaproteobacteria bacterium]